MNAPLSNYIGGRLIASGASDLIPVLNPSSGAVISEMPVSSREAVDEAVAAAKKAQGPWGRLPAIQRANALRAISARIRERVEPIARTISQEQGKLLGLAKVEVAFAADYLDYMAEWARRIEGEIIESDRPGENIFLFRKPWAWWGRSCPGTSRSSSSPASSGPPSSPATPSSSSRARRRPSTRAPSSNCSTDSTSPRA